MRQLDQIIEANLPSSRMSLSRTRNVSTSSTDSARTLEQQASMDREVGGLIVEEGAQEESDQESRGSGARISREGSADREENSQEVDESTDEGGCIVS